MGQDEEFFHLHDTKDNKPFKVAKKGLSKNLHEAIQQHFADGGEAQPEALPVDDGSMWGAAKRLGSRIGGGLSAAGSEVASVLGGGPSPDEIRMAGGRAPAPPTTLGEALGVGAAPSPAGPTVSPAPAETAPAPEAPPQAAAAPKPVATTRAGGASAGPSVDNEIAAGAKEQAAAATKMAEMEANRYAALQLNQEAHNKSQEAIWQQAQAGLKANLAAQDKLMADISNQKLDFNGHWANKSAPAQITAAIGMILGGIGSGMTMGRQGNMAADVINKAIDRDVEQQKAELGKKQNQLSMLMQQGHSLREATTLVMAHDSAAAEGRMKAIADQYAGLETAPLLQKTIAELSQKRIADTMKVHQERADLNLKAIQARRGQMELAILGDQQAQIPLQREIAAAGAKGIGLSPEYAPFMPADKTVKLDDGKLYQAATPKDKEEISETQQLAAHLKDVAQRIKAFRAQHSGGAMLPNATNDEGLELQNEAKATVAELSKKIRLTGQTGEEMKSFISNPAKWLTTDARITAQADALIERAAREVNAAVRARIMNAGGMNVSQPGLTISRAR